MPVDERQLIEGSCSRRYKGLMGSGYDAFVWVELVLLSGDESVFVPVF